ncbi:hypothetical protein EBT16_08865, partial [bacterium]|nr:hypothetical protein [bacterium]
PVVYDAYAGSLGVVTGNIGIKYQPNARSDRFASRYQIQLAQDHPDITFAFFSTRLKNVDQLLELVETVKGDPEVEYATLDLIESAAQAH